MFGTNSIVKIWEVTDKGNYSECKISSSTKNKTTDKYETDFSNNFVRFVGKAHQQRPMADQRIKLGNCGVTNKYDKEKKVTYTNYVVFDYELQGDSNPKSIADLPEIKNDSDLPF